MPPEENRWRTLVYLWLEKTRGVIVASVVRSHDFVGDSRSAFVLYAGFELCCKQVLALGTGVFFVFDLGACLHGAILVGRSNMYACPLACHMVPSNVLLFALQSLADHSSHIAIVRLRTFALA